MRYIILMLLILIVGCGEYPKEQVDYDWGIPDSNKTKAEKFIIEICKVSNPQSDEEPEDMIYQAEKTAKVLYGIKTIGIRFQNQSGGYAEFIPYWELSPRQKKICDIYLGG